MAQTKFVFDAHTDTDMDTQRQATTIPKGTKLTSGKKSVDISVLIHNK